MRGDGDNFRDRDSTTSSEPRVRLGSGDFTVKGVNPYAQLVFLHAIASCVPEALDELVALPPTAFGEYADAAPLRAWATQWGFSDPWLLSTARNHAALWREHPEMRGRWHGFAGFNWEPPSCVLNRFTESKASFEAREREYIDRLKATSAINPTPLIPWSHFERLALHHVGGWTLARLADRYANSKGYPDIPALSRELKQTASLVGLTRRKGRGRPRVEY